MKFGFKKKDNMISTTGPIVNSNPSQNTMQSVPANVYVKNTKSILFLINGLGIASKDSFSIDYAEVMPNMSMLMGNYLYTTLENINYNYKNGFRNFSLGNDLLPTYHRLESDTNFSTNQTIVTLTNELLTNQSRLHLFCFLDNDKVIDQTMKIVDTLSKSGVSAIFIHIILRQKDVIEYEGITSKIKRIEDSITLYKNTKIGTITGEISVNEEIYFKLITMENGEKWPDYSRKIDFAKQQNIIPRDLQPFYLNAGYKVLEKDSFLFLNYEDVDCDPFIERFPNTKVYTLFPLKTQKKAVHIYEEVEPMDYFAKTLEQNNLKCLVLTKEDRITSINYSLNGLKDVKCPNLDYMILNVNMDIPQIINMDYSYIIFDYDIAGFEEVRKLKEFLTTLDKQIGTIYSICEEKGYQLVISSLYGVYKNLTVGVDREVKLDYSVEVPAIIVDRNLQRSKYTFNYGTTYNLSTTILSLLTNNPSIKSSIRKRGIVAFFKS